jgi:hypothetical protein
MMNNLVKLLHRDLSRPQDFLKVIPRIIRRLDPRGLTNHPADLLHLSLSRQDRSRVPRILRRKVGQALRVLTTQVIKAILVSPTPPLHPHPTSTILNTFHLPIMITMVITTPILLLAHLHRMTKDLITLNLLFIMIILITTILLLLLAHLHRMTKDSITLNLLSITIYLVIIILLLLLPHLHRMTKDLITLNPLSLLITIVPTTLNLLLLTKVGRITLNPFLPTLLLLLLLLLPLLTIIGIITLNRLIVTIGINTPKDINTFTHLLPPLTTTGLTPLLRITIHTGK